MFEVTKGSLFCDLIQTPVDIVWQQHHTCKISLHCTSELSGMWLYLLIFVLASYFCVITLKLKCYVNYGTWHQDLTILIKFIHLNQVVIRFQSVATSVCFLPSEAEWVPSKGQHSRAIFNCVPLLCLQSENAGKFQTKSCSVSILL